MDADIRNEHLSAEQPHEETGAYTPVSAQDIEDIRAELNPPCTCPPPRRRALLVVHGAELPRDHVCREPRPGIDWSEVGRGLAIWRRA